MNEATELTISIPCAGQVYNSTPSQLTANGYAWCWATETDEVPENAICYYGDENEPEIYILGVKQEGCWYDENGEGPYCSECLLTGGTYRQKRIGDRLFIAHREFGEKLKLLCYAGKDECSFCRTSIEESAHEHQNELDNQPEEWA